MPSSARKKKNRDLDYLRGRYGAFAARWTAGQALAPSVDLATHISLIIFFFNDTANTEIYTLYLHDALPICRSPQAPRLTGRRSPAASCSCTPSSACCWRSEEHTSELQSREKLVCRLLL